MRPDAQDIPLDTVRPSGADIKKSPPGGGLLVMPVANRSGDGLWRDSLAVMRDAVSGIDVHQIVLEVRQFNLVHHG